MVGELLRVVMREERVKEKKEKEKEKREKRRRRRKRETEGEVERWTQKHTRQNDDFSRLLLLSFEFNSFGESVH